MLFLQSALDDDGVVQAVTTGGETYNAGMAYDADGFPLVNAGAVAATDRFLGGFRLTKDGELRVFDASAGLPAAYTYNQGIAMTTSGQACYTSDAYDSGDAAHLAGLAVTLDGRIYASIT